MVCHSEREVLHWVDPFGNAQSLGRVRFVQGKRLCTGFRGQFCGTSTLLDPDVVSRPTNNSSSFARGFPAKLRTRISVRRTKDPARNDVCPRFSEDHTIFFFDLFSPRTACPKKKNTGSHSLLSPVTHPQKSPPVPG